MLANRTPPWEAICFTQTGQRSGELAANYDQISAQESLDAEVWCARWAYVLTGESPQSARQREGYSRSQGCPSRGANLKKGLGKTLAYYI